LLEAMQEHQVTIGGVRNPLPSPFFVLATQNPIEQEGTYHLPEAQQDRFMFKVFVDYPSYDEEYTIAEYTTSPLIPEVEEVMSAEDIIRLQHLVRRVPIAPAVIHYALKLVRSTRIQEGEAPAFVEESVSWGAGPRAVQFLLLGGKARAVLAGRKHVTIDDIRSVAHPVMRHRVITNYSAASEGITSDKVIDQLLDTISESDVEGKLAPEVAKAFAG